MAWDGLYHARGSRVYHLEPDCPYLKRLLYTGSAYAGMGDAEDMCKVCAELAEYKDRQAYLERQQREWDEFYAANPGLKQRIEDEIKARRLLDDLEDT